MDSLDSIAPHFRLSRDRWLNAPSLTSHYETVVQSYEGTGYGLIATIRSFVECVCLTILGEYGITLTQSNNTTTEILVEALKVVGLQNSGGARNISKLISAHNKLSDALSDLRSNYDPVAHGKDGFVDTLTTNERRVFLLTADSILALILAAHDGTEPNLQYTREPYDRFAHLHGRIDRVARIEAEVEEDDDSNLVVLTLTTPNLPEGIRLRVQPSQLLYAIDRNAYVELLSSVGLDQVPVEEAAPIASDSSLRRAPEPAPVIAELVLSYNGPLASLKPSLDVHLTNIGLGSSVLPNASLSNSLLEAAESHLGLDWSTREPLLAALKVAFRRTLVHFGIARDIADERAVQLVSWFRDQGVNLQ